MILITFKVSREKMDVVSRVISLHYTNTRDENEENSLIFINSSVDDFAESIVNIRIFGPFSPVSNGRANCAIINRRIENKQPNWTKRRIMGLIEGYVSEDAHEK